MADEWGSLSGLGGLKVLGSGQKIVRWFFRSRKNKLMQGKNVSAKKITAI
jgi:hypothetical protein